MDTDENMGHTFIALVELVVLLVVVVSIAGVVVAKHFDLTMPSITFPFG